MDLRPAHTAVSAPRPWLARLHPGLFSIPVGLLGLAGAWQRLVLLGVTSGNPVSLYLFSVGLGILVFLLLLWCLKLAFHFPTARQEWSHPVQGALLALAPVGVLLSISLLAPLLPHATDALLMLAAVALALLAVGAWQVVALLTSGKMPAELVTPTLYLPTVAGGFVGALALNACGQDGFAALLMGMGAGAWALLEIRILNRLFAGPLPFALRPTLGLEIAPAAVGSLAVATLWPTLPAAVLLLCLGVACGPLFAVLTRWRYWTEVPFSVGFWSFSFPLAAMAGATVEAVRRGGWPTQVALGAVVIASAVIAFLAARTCLLLVRGRLLAPP